MTHRIQRRFAWLCAFAVLVAAMAPTVSKLVYAAQGVHWVQICTLEGRKFLAYSDTGDEVPATPAIADHYCGYCLLQQLSPAVASHSAAGALPAIESSPASPVSGSLPAPRRSGWRAHLSRAPPPALS